MHLSVYDLVSSAADDLIKKLNTRNAFKIAAELGISVEDQRIGKVMGMYTCIQHVCFISLSVRLDEQGRINVCFHELGHHVFDRSLAEDTKKRDYTIRNLKKPVELRASMLGAELWLKDEDILEMAYLGYTVDQIAMKTGAYPDFVALKIELLRHKGFDLNKIECNRNAFKVAEDRYSGSDYFPC